MVADLDDPIVSYCDKEIIDHECPDNLIYVGFEKAIKRIRTNILAKRDQRQQPSRTE